MKLNTIKTKVIVAIVGCIATVAITIVYLINHSYRQNISFISEQALSLSREAFQNQKKNETDKLSSLVRTIADNKKFVEPVAARDNHALYRMAAPFYNMLRSTYNITHWNWITPPPESILFQRMNKPEMRGDVVKRITYLNSAQSKGLSTGLELGKTGFNLRIVHPYYDQDNKIIVYIELAEEITHFLKAMKAQTGNDYGLMLEKKHLDEKEWASTRSAWGLADNWNEQAEVVFAGATTDASSPLRYEGDIEMVPDAGLVLRELQVASRVYVRGVFPVTDVSERKAGAIIVLRDITSTYSSVKSTMQTAVAAIILLAAALIAIVIFILHKLVFRRLDGVVAAATRVVGGDIESQIVCSVDDEVGRLETLLEQFRVVFVNTLNDVEQANKSK